MNVVDLLAAGGDGNLSRAALVAGFGPARRNMSFAHLHANVASVAAQFVSGGLKPGDRVLLAVPVSIETYIVMLALLKAGMVIMFIDPAHSANRVSRILRKWPPDAVVATRAILLLRFLVPDFGRVSLKFCIDGRPRGATRLRFGDSSATVPTCQRKAADSALLTFTSGSTGEPKAVVRTHGFLRHQLDMLDRIADFGPREIDYVAMPMFVLFNLASGVTSVLPACDMKQPAKADPATVRAQLHAERATRVVASPALLERLADFCLARKVRLPDIRRYSTGGGPVSPDLAGKLETVSPGMVLRMVYGSTEAEPIAFVDNGRVSSLDRSRMQAGSGLLAGRPVAGCNVRIALTSPGVPLAVDSNDAFERLCLGPGEIGEIVVAGRHVLTGYADAARDRETKIKLPGATWHRTGDAGYFDSDGRLWLVGRCNAVINDGHGSVYPFQVEYAANAIPGIARSALVMREGMRTLVIEATGQGLSRNCDSFARCVAAHRIARIRTVSRIPVDRRHNAKIDYPSLQRLLDGRIVRARLYLAEQISFAFRGARRMIRSALYALVRHVSSTRNLRAMKNGAPDPPAIRGD